MTDFTDLKTQAEMFAIRAEQKWKDLQNTKTGLLTFTVNLEAAMKFFITAVDEAVKFAQANMTVGAEKKAFVLLTVGRLYDTLITPYLPIWLYPWQSSIKNIVVNTLISNLIEFVVSKYKDGSFGPILPVPVAPVVVPTPNPVASKAYTPKKTRAPRKAHGGVDD